MFSVFQKFIKVERLSGVLLFGATIIALIWANSPFGHTYEMLWQYELGVNTEDFQLSKPLILWVNDGLMAIFFFLIGLEIKRELLMGELNSIKNAALPLFAAIGGMVIPITLFFILNRNPETSQGWGIAMATDIAFSLAILKLLGNRVPLSLKIFLTAFAIVDDIGAVLVIAVFYSTGINWGLIAVALLLLAVLFVMSRYGIYVKYLFFVLGLLIWFLFLKSGIHPTVAGVLLAFAIPIRQKIDVKTFTQKLAGIVKKIGHTEETPEPILSTGQIEQIDDLEDWITKVQSPLQQLEHRLHDWVAYFIMPVFALSNAGVVFSNDMHLDFSLIAAIALSLILGKCIGITSVSLLTIKLKLAELPNDFGHRQIFGVAMLAGVGFTMSIFIANLAFAGNDPYMDSAKVGIFIGSIVSGLAGYLILKTGSKKGFPEEIGN